VDWRAFKVWFINRLIVRHITPVCGAHLPGGPKTTDSRCHAAGLLNGDNLHLDHEPPLRPEERVDRRAVCDPMRVQLLCQSCHAAKSAQGVYGSRFI